MATPKKLPVTKAPSALDEMEIRFAIGFDSSDSPVGYVVTEIYDDQTAREALDNAGYDCVSCQEYVLTVKRPSPPKPIRLIVA